MYIKKALLVLFLSLSISSLAMAESDNSPASSNASQQVETATQTSELAPTADSNAASSKKPDADKKPSMAEYCRKNMC